MPTHGGGSGALSILQAAAIDDTRLGASALRMLVALGTYADAETGWCWPKQKVLGDRLGITRQAVSRALRTLAACGYIEIEEQHDPTTGARIYSRYRLLMDVKVPPECRRTPQPDVAGGVKLALRPLQPDVAAPATSDVATPVNPSVTSPATSDVAAIEERPKGTTQEERPIEDVAADAAAAATTRDQTAILRGLSEGARQILDWHRQCHGRRRPAKLTPEAALFLEEAVADLGVERLREAVQFMARKIPAVPELSKAINAARTKRLKDESGVAPAPYRTDKPAPRPGSLAARTKSERFGG